MNVCEINFLDIEENQEYADTVSKVLTKCYKEENLKDKNLYTNVVLTNSKNIKELNKKYRNIDKETDVLSFPMFNSEADARNQKAKRRRHLRRYSDIHRTSGKAKHRIWPQFYKRAGIYGCTQLLSPARI